MKIRIHLPRKTEGEIHPPHIKTDIEVTPKFYKKTGLVPVFYFTTVDAKGHEEQHVLSVNAANKRVVVEKLVEVVPYCDVENEEAPLEDSLNEDQS